MENPFVTVCPPCPICGNPGMMVKPFNKPQKPAGWCGKTECYEVLAMDGFRAIIARLNEGPSEELLRLQTVVRRLLAGMKDAKYWCSGSKGEVEPWRDPRPEAAIMALQKAAKECGLEIPE